MHIRRPRLYAERYEKDIDGQQYYGPCSRGRCVVPRFVTTDVLKKDLQVLLRYCNALTNRRFDSPSA